MILITGSSGYIGKNFINTFQDKYKIKTFSLQEASLKTIDLSNIDTIIHCAALVHKKKSHTQQEYDRVNVEYPVQLAKKAKASGVKQFIYLSTIAVYGDKLAIITEDSKCFPLTPYGKSKLTAEELLIQLNNSNFTISIIRPPMVYGKNAPGNIQSLISLVKKLPILPFANIQNIRSFIYIDNLICMINCVLEKKISGVLLVTDDKALSTTKLIELISKALNKNIILVNIPFFETLLKFTKPTLHRKLYENLEISNSKTKRLLQCNNIYHIEDGIKYMLQGEKT